MNSPLGIMARIVDPELAAQLLSELRMQGWVVVPKEPTPAMIDAAWAEALAENAEGEWRDMIQAVTR